MKIAINYRVTKDAWMFINPVQQIVVEIERIDELAHHVDRLKHESGVDCIVDYFQVPDCATVTRD